MKNNIENNIENERENAALTLIALFTIAMISSVIISTYLTSLEAGNTSANHIGKHIISNLTSFHSLFCLPLVIAIAVLSIHQSFKLKEPSRAIKYISLSLLTFIGLNITIGYKDAIHEQEQLNCKTNGVRCEMPTTEKLASEIINGSKLYIFSKEAK